MGAIRTNAAAAMLGVSTNTLRSWERRFSYPTPARTAGGHRQYDLAEIEALRAAFEETQNISSAVAVARARGVGPASSSRLRSAFTRFDEAEADRLLEESMAIRSLERTVEEVLLPSIESLCDGDAPGRGPSAEFVFAARWATGWLAAVRRLSPPATRTDGVLIFDGSVPGDVESLHAQALELVLRRGGWRTLSFTVDLDVSRLTRALTALEPRVVVLTGRQASLDALGRLVFAARRGGAGRVEVFDYRDALPNTGASTVVRLGDSPLEARALLTAWADAAGGRTPSEEPSAPLRDVSSL